MRTSIVWKLTLFVGVLVALNTALLIGAAYFATSRILRNAARDRLTTIAEDRRLALARGLDQQVSRAMSLGAHSRARGLMARRAAGAIGPEQFQGETEEYLTMLRSSIAGVQAIWIEDAAGRMIVSSGLDGPLGERATAERIGPPAGTEAGLAVPPRAADDNYDTVFSGKLIGENGEALGELFLVVGLGELMTSLAGPHGLGKTGEVLVGWKRGGRIHLALPPRVARAPLGGGRDHFPALDAAAEGRSGFTREIDYRGRDVLAAFEPLGAGYPGWGLIAKIDADEAYRPVARLRRLLLVLGLGGLVLGLGAAGAIARRFTRPIRQMARASAAVAAGDLTARCTVGSDDELGELGLAFNGMTDELERARADLERRIVERTRALAASRDLLDAFFRISTSSLDGDNIENTYDSVLRFCADLGYDLAMVSLVDRQAGVVRAVRASGEMAEIVGLTVRPLDGDDVLAIAAREKRTIAIADARSDPLCEPGAVALTGIRGHIVLPLIVGEEALGTLQVASREVLDPAHLDMRPLESLASHTARALGALRHIDEIGRLNETLERHARELTRSEMAYREQTRILQSVLDCMGDGVVVADSSGRFLVFNPAAARILGQSRIDIPYSDWSRRYEVYLPDRATIYPVEHLPLVRAMRGESVDQAELYISYPSRDDGTWILVTGRPLRDERGELEGGVVVFHDITRRKKAEHRLTAQYETTRALAEAESPGQVAHQVLRTIGTGLDWDLGAFWRLDARAQKLHCASIWRRDEHESPRFEEATLATPLGPGIGLPGRAWTGGRAEWIPDVRRDANFPRRGAAVEEGWRAAVAFPIMLQGECRGVLEFFSREARPPDPATLEMMDHLGSQLGQFIERHQMRARVTQSEKLASLGMLSAGVAHEINNPLAYVINNLSVLDRDARSLLDLIAVYENGRAALETAQPELARQAAAIVEECDLPYVQANLLKLIASTTQGAQRVADIVRNLRGFARLDRADNQRADVHEAVGAALEMLRVRLERQGITVEKQFGAVPAIAGSPVQLNQIFLNLLVNAHQAIEAAHRREGRIAVSTVFRNGEVVVEVADNGCGIPESHMPQLFDPFFTTKEIGDGIGLGLSITHGMVQDHGGRLEVESAIGQGSRFRVVLPVERPAE